MIRKISVYKAVGTDPYINLATEKYLTDTLSEETAVLYLWQNRDTVVIGTNQNPWAECRCDVLEKDGGFVARRMTGGGAVFHDVGNLNFSFICKKEDYDLARNLDVIARACEMSGISVSVSGRNDILAGGRKFSGNAFLTRAGVCLHHGTLLIRSDVEKMTKYLSPSKQKLEAKGVKSVRSRVVNLCEICETLTAERMSEYMLCAFEEVFGMKAYQMPIPSHTELCADIAMFSDREYIYGKTPPFTATFETRTEQGNLTLLADVKNGKIQSVKVYTDSLDTTLAHRLETELVGKDYALVTESL